MVPVHAGLGNEEVGLLVVVVKHTRLGSVQTAAAHATATAEATAATAAEAHVIGIVGVEHTHQAMVAAHHHAKQASGIAVFRTRSQVGIGHRTAVHAGTQSEVEHGLLVTVVDTRDTGQVALLVVGADTLDDAGRQVLQCCLGIAELLVVDLDLRHLLTVDLDVTVVVDLGTRQALHQFLNDGALRRAVGIGIIY